MWHAFAMTALALFFGGTPSTYATDLPSSIEVGSAMGRSALFPHGQRWGVNIHFTDNTRAYAMIKPAFRTVRMDLQWAAVEKSQVRSQQGG